MKRLNLLLAACVVLGVSASARAAGYEYIVTDLGTLSGPVSSAVNLDTTGRVVGQSTLASAHYRGVLWNGGPIDLGALPGDAESLANAVNASGLVVGISYNYGDLQPHAFSWQAGVMTGLGNFSPRDVNAGGVIIGHRTFFNGVGLLVDQACSWSGGTLAGLGTLGGDASDAFAINTTGVVVGQSHLVDNLTVRACAWVGGTPHDLGTLAGTTTAKSAAADVNDAGQVVGWSETAGGQPRACLFQIDAGGVVTSRTNLGLLGGGYSYAYGINNSGVVVGCSNAHGFIRQAGTMTDLNTLIPAGSGWLVSRASAINDSGQIVADGILNGFTHALLLTRVTCNKGDVNNDGSVNGLDIQLFVQVLMTGGTPQQTCAGDMQTPYDGHVTAADVSSFVACLLGTGSCG